MSGTERDEIIRRFAELWWAEKNSTIGASRWCGIPTLQHPFDAWITQEIICEVAPDLIVECGSWKGGSAVMWATLLGQINPQGRVLTIDIDGRLAWHIKRLPAFLRVDTLKGSTVDPHIIDQVRAEALGKRTLVILDSNHSKEHVAAELDAYSPLVSPGSYLIVQDTIVDMLEPDARPGPTEAIVEFLERDPQFEIDRNRERMLFTFNPSGFLRRIGTRP